MPSLKQLAFLWGSKRWNAQRIEAGTRDSLAQYAGRAANERRTAHAPAPRIQVRRSRGG